MKKILLLLLLPLMVFSQSERQQKQNIRNSLPSPTIPPPLNPISPARENSFNEYQQKQSVRENYRRNNTPNNNISNGNVYVYDPYWNGGWGGGWNRWNRWGAPMWGWDYWEPHWYYDRWGYRQPARIYYQEGGKTIDTVKGVKPVVSVGLQINKNNIGGFFTIGKTVYFLAEYEHTYKIDESTYYPNLTTDQVIPWNDKKLSDIRKGGTLYVGVGRRYGKTGIHSAFGIAHEKVRFQYFDELYILSNNGKYSIPSYNDNYLSLKVGLIHDFKLSTIKVDYELLKKQVTFGLGVNF